MKVLLHTRPSRRTEGWEWTNTVETFEQVPHVGEFVCRKADSDWFRVQLVLWLAEGAKADVEVEIYAVFVDRHEALERETADEPVSEQEIHDRPTLVDPAG